jgi:hypothetical protein
VLQTLGVPPQVPLLLQVSPLVQALASSQGVPVVVREHAWLSPPVAPAQFPAEQV